MKKIIAAFLFLSAVFLAAAESYRELAVVPVQITASSTTVDDDSNSSKYGPKNLCDNSWKSWAGKGKNIEINFDFGKDVTVSFFEIRNGYGSLGYYLKNNRVKNIDLYFGQNSSEALHFTLPDTPDPQIESLGEEITTSKIKMIITDIYAGSEFDDTCIAEISWTNNESDCKAIDKIFNYDAWRCNLFTAIYKNHSAKVRTSASGRCEIYGRDDFEAAEKTWIPVKEYLNEPVMPVGYRGMGDWYSIFPVAEGALVLEYTSEDLDDLNLKLYTWNGKVLLEAKDKSAIKPVTDYISSLKKSHLRYGLSYTKRVITIHGSYWNGEDEDHSEIFTLPEKRFIFKNEKFIPEENN